MRTHYIPIELDNTVSGLRFNDIRDEVKHAIFYKKMQKRIGHLYIPILSYTLDPYVQRKHEHNTLGYALESKSCQSMGYRPSRLHSDPLQSQ